MSRAQASLEFLTTYGWAFMVIIIMIGALSYYGITNPSVFVPKHCTFSPEISCEDFQLVHDGSQSVVLLNLRQTTGKTIYIENFVCRNTDNGVESTIENAYISDAVFFDVGDANPLKDVPDGDALQKWNPSEELFIACALDNDPFEVRAGSQMQVPVTLSVYKVDPTQVSDPFTHEYQGDVVGVVQEIE